MITHTGSHHDHTAKIHIITVYYGLTDRNNTWLELQQRFIQKNTTVPYRFSIFANGCDDIFDDLDIIGSEEYSSHHKIGQNHLSCLRKAVMEFDESCDYLLILDSDCFPIRPNWHDELSRAMAHRGYQIAAPYRLENLDKFPHPCAMFMTKKGAMELDLVLTTPDDSMLEGMPNDPTCSNRCFPLIRSNRVNVHPLAAGIYYDMFYHHGAGSRNSLFRITDVLQYWHYPDHQEWVDRAYKLLVEDAESFIASLLKNPLGT